MLPLTEREKKIVAVSLDVACIQCVTTVDNWTVFMEEVYAILRKLGIDPDTIYKKEYVK